MGLLLSVLVTCVGVVELLTFYHNVKRRVNNQAAETSLTSVQDQYLKELESVRDRLAIQLNRLKNGEIVSAQTNIPTLRLNSHEDVNVEFDDQFVARSRSISSNQFLVTNKDISASSPTEQFLESEELQADQGIKKSRAQECLPEYLIEESTTSGGTTYVLKDDNHDDHNDPVPLPLPENFLISEHEKEIKTDVFRKKLGHSIVELDGELYFRRSSPFPNFDLTAPRTSVCSELLDDTVSVAEVDEFSRSNSHSPVNVERTYESNNIPEINNNSEKNNVILESATHNSKEFWNNEAPVIPSKQSKCRSSSPEVLKKQKEDLLQLNWQRCVSKTESNIVEFSSHVQTCSKIVSSLEFSEENRNNLASESENEIDVAVEVQMYTKKAKNNLDGLDKGKGCIKKRMVRRKRTKNRHTSKDKTDSVEANNSNESAVLPVEKNTNANNLSKTRSLSENTGNVKPGEPFWLIFSGEYTKAMNKDFHGQHFCCWQCDESLTGQRYVLRDDHPYCVSCYESVFANACEKCSRTIGIDSKDLSYKDKHWHEACFLCTSCGESLVDKQFGSKGDRIYCGRCYDEQFASKCDGCHEIFRAGTKKMEYKTRQWHEKCFCCCVCKVPIGTQSFIPREQEIFCAKCYEEKFATRCIKCNKVITSGGVTYKNEPWHRECFTCTNCTKSLAGERFTSRDEKPYCAECFGELFAKRCFACNKPITGIGGTKFISFEDRHWHNDCFFCASCRTSLVGRGFITDQEDIICPECAKQKLM